MTSPEFDIVIVGAGMAGASLAWQLTASEAALAAAEPGGTLGRIPRVLLIEREAQPGYHTTGRSAALFMESYGPAGIQALTRAGRAFYTQPPAGFSEGPLVSPRGAMYIAAEGEEADLWAMGAALSAQGAQVTRLSADDARQRVPLLRPEACAAALYEDDVLDMDVHAIHQGFLRGFRQQGGRLLSHTALLQVIPPQADVPVGALPDAAVWQLQLTGEGAEAFPQGVRCTTLVNAAGAWADEVGRQCGAAPIGLQPKRRSAFTFALPDGVDASGWPMLLDWQETFYLKPDAGLVLGSPANADPMPPHDVQPEELDIAIGIDRIERCLDVQIRRPRATWAGLRCFVADGEPVIGWDDAVAAEGTAGSNAPSAHGGVPGLFWLTAQGGYGIQSAAGASALAASLLRKEPLPAHLQRALQAQGVGAAHFAASRLRQPR